MAPSHDIISLYSNRSCLPSNNPWDSPSYLDFVRTMNDTEPPPTSPPPPYAPPVQAVELPCPYSERKMLKIEESEKQPRPNPLEVVHAHIVPLPTICVTPPTSTASSPTGSTFSSRSLSRSASRASQFTTVFSPVPGVLSATLPVIPPLRRKPTPRRESLREVRQRESEMWLREVYERQTRQFIQGGMWRGIRHG